MNVLADHKINVTQQLKFYSEIVENIVGKGKNAGTSIFSFSNGGLKSLLSESCQNLRLYGKELTL